MNIITEELSNSALVKWTQVRLLINGLVPLKDFRLLARAQWSIDPNLPLFLMIFIDMDE